MKELLASVRVGEAVGVPGLRAVQLFGPDRTPPYLLAAEAAKTGKFSVEETGIVPKLHVVNLLAQPVLILDGQILSGGRQTRICNTSVLVGAGQKVDIDVSCVEQGRWSYRRRQAHGVPRWRRVPGERIASRRPYERPRDPGAEEADRVVGGEQSDAATREDAGRDDVADLPDSIFRLEAPVEPLRLRARRILEVTEAARREGTRRANQGAVWRDVAAMGAAHGAHSPTGSLEDVFEAVRPRLRPRLDQYTVAPGQTGVAWVVDGRVTAVELFDASTTFAAMAKRLTEAALLAAPLDGQPDDDDPAAVVAEVEAFLRRVAEAGNAATEFPGLGIGRERRAVIEDVAVLALLDGEGMPVHVAGYRRAAAPA